MKRATRKMEEEYTIDPGRIGSEERPLGETEIDEGTINNPDEVMATVPEEENEKYEEEMEEDAL